MSVQVEKFQCPYCEKQSASPGGLRFHIKLEHPEKFDEFNQKHYSKMIERFKLSIAIV